MNLFDTIGLVSDRLTQLNVEHAFIGGSVIPFLIDDPNIVEFRPTKDVDAIVQVVTQAEYSKLEERLRANGFTNDTSRGAPICRYLFEGCIVDIMPINPSAIGFASKWLPSALNTAAPTSLPSGQTVRVVTAPYFVATKLDAFSSRGRGDYLGSRDLEDLVSIIDGRSKIVQEVFEIAPDARNFISTELDKLLNAPEFSEAVIGHVPQDFDPYTKAQGVLTNIRRIVQEVQFAEKLEFLGVRTTRIIEAEASPPFQPPGSGVIISGIGRRTYRIRCDISGLLLNALASGAEGLAIEIYNGANTPLAWEIIAEKISELETT